MPNKRHRTETVDRPDPAEHTGIQIPQALIFENASEQETWDDILKAKLTTEPAAYAIEIADFIIKERRKRSTKIEDDGY